MKINVIKSHHKYPLGVQDVEEGIGNYLVKMGVAEEATTLGKYTVTFTPEDHDSGRKLLGSATENEDGSYTIHGNNSDDTEWVKNAKIGWFKPNDPKEKKVKAAKKEKKEIKTKVPIQKKK